MLKNRYSKEFEERCQVCPEEQMIKINMKIELTFKYKPSTLGWFEHTNGSEKHMWQWTVSIDDPRYQKLAPFLIQRVNSVPANPNEPTKPFYF